MIGTGTFVFNEIESNTFELYCKSVKRPVLPTLRTRYDEIADKHGAVDHGGNKYTLRPIQIHIAYIGTDYVELRARTREIAAWLSTDEWSKLIINDEPYICYMARVYNEIDIETLKKFGECDITFLCQPFAYALVDTAINPTWEEADFPWLTAMPWIMSEAYRFTATGTTTFEFNNPGTANIGSDAPERSKSLIEITGSWTTLTVAMNGKTLTYTDADSGTLVIDNIEMEITLDGDNVLDDLNGDLDSFLTIIPGENEITVSGTGINVSVQLDFIPMWK